MNQDSTAVMQQQLQDWLKEENYVITAEPNPNTLFSINAQSPMGLRLFISQHLNSKDKIEVGGPIILQDFLKQFEQLTEPDRIAFLWDLRYTLIANQLNFVMLPDGARPNRIVILKHMWYDGVNKDRFMGLCQRVLDGMLLTIWKFRQKLGASKPRENHLNL